MGPDGKREGGSELVDEEMEVRFESVWTLLLSSRLE